MNKWGLGIGDWGLGIGDWAQFKFNQYNNKIKNNLFNEII